MAAVPVLAVVRIKEGVETSDLFATGKQLAVVTQRSGMAPDTVSYEFDHVYPNDIPLAQVFAQAVLPLTISVLSGRHALLLVVGEAHAGQGETLSGPGLHSGSSAEPPPGVVQLALRRMWADGEFGADGDARPAGRGGWVMAMQHVAMYQERPFDLLGARLVPAPLFALDAPVPGCLSRGLEAFRATSVDELVGAYARSLVALHTLAAEQGISVEAITTVCTFTLRQPDPAFAAERVRAPGSAPLMPSALKTAATADAAGDDELWSRLTVCRVGGWELLADPLNELRLRLPAASFASPVALGRALVALAERKSAGAVVDGRSAALTRLLGGQLGGNAQMALLCCVKVGSAPRTKATLDYATRARAGRSYPVVNSAGARALHRQLQSEVAELRDEIAAIAATGAARGGGALASEEAAHAALRHSELEGELLRADMRAAALAAEREAARAESEGRFERLTSVEEERRLTLARLLESEEESVRRGQALLDLKVEREAEAAAAETLAAELDARLVAAEATASAESARAAQLGQLNEAATLALSAARAEIAELEEDLVAYRSTLLTLRADGDAAAVRVGAIEGELVEAASAAAVAEAARDEARSAARALSAELRGAEAEAERARDQADRLRAALAEQRAGLASTAGRASDLELKADGAHARLELARAAQAAAEAAVRDGEAARTAAERAAHDARAEAGAARADADTARRERADALRALAGAHDERVRVVEALADARAREVALSEEAAELRRRARGLHDDSVARIQAYMAQLGARTDASIAAAEAAAASGHDRVGAAPPPAELRDVGARARELQELLTASYAEREAALERAAADAGARALELARQLDELEGAHDRLLRAAAAAPSPRPRAHDAAAVAAGGERAASLAAAGLAPRRAPGGGAESQSARELVHAADRRVAAAESGALAIRQRLAEAEATYRLAVGEMSARFRGLEAELRELRAARPPVHSGVLEQVASRSLAAQDGLMAHLRDLEQQRAHEAQSKRAAADHSQEVLALRRENEALLAQLQARLPTGDGKALAFRAQQLQLELSKAEGERARLASRAANAEEQLEQLQTYMTQHIASHQKEILSLRGQLSGQRQAKGA